MNVGIPALLCLSFVLQGCEKVKNIKGAEQGSAAPSTTADPALQKLVFRENGGVVFRQDLPFPTNLRVDVTRQMSGKYSGYSKSELGRAIRQNQPISSHTLLTLERSGEHVRYTSGVVTPPPEANGKSAARPKDHQKPPGTANPADTPPPQKVVLVLRRTTGKWKADPTSDFRAKVLALDLEKSFAEALAVSGAAPLKEWLPRRPFKPGDEIVLKDARLSLLGGEFEKGQITLKFEGEEAVEGHPCGVFRTKGSASGKSGNDTEMPGAATDMTIQDGRIWFSLLYPVTMRTEYSAIATMRSSGSRLNGSKKVEETKAWKPGTEPK